MDFAALSFGWLVACFAIAAAIIATAGTKLTHFADRLADRTGMGEALAGAVLLGASTSLPGIITSVTAAWNGFPELAISNAVGGIAAQTAFLAVADIFYPKANLEHAAASQSNLLQCALLVALLSIPLITASLPAFTIWAIHPATPLLFGAYLFGLSLVHRAKASPMWHPQHTTETIEDKPDQAAQKINLFGLLVGFAMLALLVAVAGWIVAKTGIELAARTGLSQTAVGGVFTAVATSLPELITSIAAVRAGALTLAVGGIVGGNAFDILFLAAADVAWRDGSIYHQMNAHQDLLISASILMNSILLLGLIYREKKGPGKIGFESISILILYAAILAFLFTEG